LLIDTGSTLSVLRRNVIPENAFINRDNIVVNGIGGRVTANCYADIQITLENHAMFNHRFYLLDNLPCQTDGIIGLDFLRTNSANIDLSNNKLTMFTNGNVCVVQIHRNSEYGYYLTIPARSESIHFLPCTTENQYDRVIRHKQLSENIFLAGGIVRPNNGKIPVQILNSSDQDIRLPIFDIETDSLDDFELCTLNKTQTNVNRVKQLLPQLNLNHLNLEERKSIEIICAKFSDIFYLEGDTLTTTNIMSQSIALKPDIKPIYTKPYRLPQALKPEIDKQIKKMLREDIIEETNSEWSSPILLVPKKEDDKGNKKWRLVVDFRKINDVIQDDKFPLPNITEILDALSGSIYFSHLDLNQGFYQVSLEPESRKITAFTTSTGQYHMKRLPMGLKISPSAFSRVMSVALSGLTYEKCFVYCDDVIIFGRNLDTHNKNLIKVFERFREVNLKLNPLKCDFLKKNILYLGHVVSSEGILPDPQKTKTLENYPVPKNADEVRRFVAFCNYYRKFITNFAEITLPLNKLCRKHVPFVWSNECEQAFAHLKTALITPPILQYPDFSNNNEFILQTDASGIAIASVLCNSDMRPVAYTSRPLNKAELNYPTIQKELLAIVWSVKYFRPYLYGRTFTIMTDHKPLLYLFGMKDPSSRLLKFRLTLEEFDFKIVYIRGKDNVIADALSRIIITSDDLKNINKNVMTVMTRAQTRKLKGLGKDTQGNPNISTDKRTDQPRVVEILRKPSDLTDLTFICDKDIYTIVKRNKITRGEKCFVFVPNEQQLYVNLKFQSHFTRDVFVNELKDFCEKNNIKKLCIVKNTNNASFIKDVSTEIYSRKEWTGPQLLILEGVRKIIDSDEKTFILQDYHLLPTSGHAGVRRMVNNIKRKYFWPRLEDDVRNFVRKCSKCQIMKHSPAIKQPMVITTTAESALDKIYLDIVGPLDKDIDGNVYILTLQCELSKYVEAYAIPSKDTVTVAKAFVNNFILRYGIPKAISTDRGTEFMSLIMLEVCKLLHIDKQYSTAYHHQSLGALENSHKTLRNFLRIQCEENIDTWGQWLPFWCFAYNNTVHTSTSYAPFELVYGKQCVLPSRLNNNIVEPVYNIDNYVIELRYRIQLANKDAREKLILDKHKRKLSYDQNAKSIVYEKDSLVR
jgi:hypothetical protein